MARWSSSPGWSSSPSWPSRSSPSRRPPTVDRIRSVDELHDRAGRRLDRTWRCQRRQRHRCPHAPAPKRSAPARRWPSGSSRRRSASWPTAPTPSSVRTSPRGCGRDPGFFIDSSGIAVTNNHVVTGASTLDVYVNGSDKPVNARVLGVSECADLAVIKVDGAGFTALPLQRRSNRSAPTSGPRASRSVIRSSPGTTATSRRPMPAATPTGRRSRT